MRCEVCGSPFVTDPDLHAAWHSTCEAQGVPRGRVDLNATRAARGVTRVQYRTSKPAVDRPVVRTGRARESQQAARKALARSGTLRAQALALVAARGPLGATSDELERKMGRAHQSVSATLNTLEGDGLCERVGPVRQTANGAEARAYVVTPYGLAELRRVRQPRPGSPEWTDGWAEDVDLDALRDPTGERR